VRDYIENEGHSEWVVHGAGGYLDVPDCGRSFFLCYLSDSCVSKTTSIVQFQLTFLSFEDNEHGFSLRYSAAQGMIALSGLIAKALVEVSPDSATVGLPFSSCVMSPSSPYHPSPPLRRCR
jgi:hypothetical protein